MANEAPVAIPLKNAVLLRGRGIVVQRAVAMVLLLGGNGGGGDCVIA